MPESAIFEKRDAIGLNVSTCLVEGKNIAEDAHVGASA
jgi:hypothetical protein